MGRAWAARLLAGRAVGRKSDSPGTLDNETFRARGEKEAGQCRHIQAHSQQAHGRREVEVDRVVATPRTYGVLTRARLADCAERAIERAEINDDTRRNDMTQALYPATTDKLAAHRAALASETHHAFQAFSRQVVADGALPEKTKQLIAVAVAHVTQCPYCIDDELRSIR
jgi:hypothetical protein